MAGRSFPQTAGRAARRAFPIVSDGRESLEGPAMRNEEQAGAAPAPKPHACNPS